MAVGTFVGTGSTALAACSASIAAAGGATYVMSMADCGTSTCTYVTARSPTVVCGQPYASTANGCGIIFSGVAPIVGALANASAGPITCAGTQNIPLTQGWSKVAGVSTWSQLAIAYPVPSTSAPQHSCQNGCDATVNAASPSCGIATAPSSNGMFPVVCNFDATATGSTCSTVTSADPNGVVANAPCSGSLGTVNGVPTCLASAPPAGTTAAPPPTPGTGAATGASGSGIAGSNDVGSSAPGSVGNALAVTNGLGGALVVKNATNPVSDFCTANPTAAMCKITPDSSASASAICSTPPACTGDAIQCAILKQSWDVQCAVTYTADPTSALGAAVLAGTDPLASTLPTTANGSTVAVDSAFASAMGSRILTPSCLASPSFTVMGRSFSIDFTGVCNSLGIAGNIFVALCLLGSIKIIGRGGA